MKTSVSEQTLIYQESTRPLDVQDTPHRRDLIWMDLVCLNASLLIALVLAYGSYVVEIKYWQWFLLFLLPNVAWGLISVYNQAYSWYERRFLQDEIYNVIKIIVIHFAVVSVLYYNSNLIETKRSFLLVAYLLFTVTTVVSRAINRNQSNRFIKPFKYIVVGGKPHNVRTLLQGFQYAFGGKAELVGRFGNTPMPLVDTIGAYSDLRNYILTNQTIKKVVFIYSPLSIEEEREIIAICQRRFIDIEVLPRETNLLPGGFKLQRHGSMPILTVKEEPLTRLANKIAKRAFDLIVSGLVILFVFPWLMPIVALCIVLESKGGVFFCQERSGYLNEPFQMIKFRTMVINEDSDSKQAQRGDARVTKVGAFLRKTSLDEFPQFWNVFKGDMSIVGPRPHMLQHTTQYSKFIETYLIRHKIKPGITGWAQVNGSRGPTAEVEDMRRRVDLDVWYLSHWSLALDIRCVIQTVINAVRGEENAL